MQARAKGGRTSGLGWLLGVGGSRWTAWRGKGEGREARELNFQLDSVGGRTHARQARITSGVE